MKPRAPFIWINKGPLPSIGEFRKSDALPQNRWFLFRHAFHVNEVPEAAVARITADGRYQLFVNGTRIGRGPMRSLPEFQKFDEYDLTNALGAGKNTIGVLVHTYGIDTGWYELARNTWSKHFGDGGLWFECDIAFSDGSLATVDADETWRGIELAAWSNDTPRMQDGLGFIEDFDARAFPANWLAPDFAPIGWGNAIQLGIGGGGPEAFLGGLEIRPFPNLLPRSIPVLQEYDLFLNEIVQVTGLVPRPDLPVERRAYEEAFVPAPQDAIRSIESLLSTDGVTRIKSFDGLDTSVVLAFDKLITGYPFIEFEAAGGEVIEIVVSENLPGAYTPEGARPDARITPSPLADTTDAHICRIVARSGYQRFERFEWDAVRWMQVIVRNAPNGINISKVGVRFTTYPVEPRGRFNCSDPFLERLWSAGAYTVQLCMHDAWEDCPGREQRQWLGDATVEHLVGQAAFGPSVGVLNANFLRDASRSQRPDGLMEKFTPGDSRDNALGIPIPDWTLQWILNAGDHWLYTGDLDVVEEIFPSIQKALAWFELQCGPSGLMADIPHWHFMDWAAFGRTGEACAINAQFAGALSAASDLADALGYGRAAFRYSARSKSVVDSLNERHWDERRGCFVDVVDSRSGAQGRRVSQHSNAAMALWGGLTAERRKRALDYVTDQLRLVFTEAPPITRHSTAFDEEHDVVLANTFYSHFVYTALFRDGRAHDALMLMRDRLSPMVDSGSATLWESLDPSASLCHGFSASPTWQLSSGILGVRPIAGGFSRAAFAPNLAHLQYANGIVPTPHGDIEIELRRDGKGFLAKIAAPNAVEIVIDAVSGLSISGKPSFTNGIGTWHFTSLP